MFSDFVKEKQKISENIDKVLKGMQDTSALGVSLCASFDAQTTLIRLINPTIFTSDHCISIYGEAFLTSLLECKKVVQGRYSTPGVNRFPKIVDDMLKTGSSSELARLGRFDTRAARTEINNLLQIYRSRPDDKIVLLSGINPVIPVSEYVIDGRHTSGIPLRAFDVPIVVKAERARLEFTSISGVKITDSRIEQHSVIDIVGAEFIIKGVQNNIIVNKRQSRERLGDYFAVASIISIALGAASIFIRRGRLLEIGIPFLIIGIIMFWIRYFSDWGNEYFAPSEIEISGDAPFEMSLYGEME